MELRTGIKTIKMEDIIGSIFHIIEGIYMTTH
jgi:hypothetical protein